ncbi:presequence protease, mitochondrial [Drosophila bipectinata]|uniref:presequence protease, mitochondrial n=1 Tax=Drosophila bipectinata TaxID=42026 RepID=UPI001C8A929D|nr:presequence protease, mitochondrial [Drosophila bipectinata]XP_017093926.2 presequence protease, mitochondrial [Drosophila bipectinata]XP_017093928.2 presequence protease, mitochondrial [Drosophila bipectinata]
MISKSKWLNLSVRGRRILYPRLAVPSRSASSFRDATGATASEAKKSSNVQVIDQRDSKYAEGKVYHGFKCERIEYVSDFELTSYTLRHEGTGTELWHIHRNDANNVFSINFRTTPFDSTGLPHILEHLALCGSKNYPVRDPFFKMLNRSVATFMNAMTGPDYTLYPFSTMNEVDYRNLQRIYLDAVFRPNLKYLDFLQEGWRLENKDLKDRKSELVIKGVVYNEMKGAFSENSQVFGQNLLNNVLPDHTYGHISGGNPLEIPKLTHTDLVEFHQKYYHPSNARIFSYGSFDLSKTLELVDKEYLSGTPRIDSSYSQIPAQPRWKQPRNVHISSRLDNMGAAYDRQNQIAIALLMSDITNIQESFELNVLSELLIRGPNSAFYKSLIEPNFSGGYNQSTGYSADTKDTSFVVGLQDLRVEDFKKFGELFDQTIHKAIEEGFQHQHVESILNNLELSLKHQSPHFGNSLLFNTTALWNHDGDVVGSLRVSEMIACLRKNLRDQKTYFQDKIQKYLANNTHRLTLTMSPDESYEEKFKVAESEMLKQKVKALDKEKLEEIYNDGKKLEESQKSVENTEALPCLTLKDVSDPPKWPKLNTETVQNVSTQICTVPTNEITYVKCLFNITGLSQAETTLVPLFCSVINEMGTSKYNFREFDKMILSKTGGIDFKFNVVENVQDAQSYQLSVMMTTFALDKNVPDMFGLCQELLQNFTFADSDRLQMLIENYISNISVGVASSGHLYAMLGATSLVSDAGKLRSVLSGVDHIEFMKTFSQELNVANLQETLKKIGQKIFNKSNMRVAINCSEPYLTSALNHCSKFLETIPAQGQTDDQRKIQFFDPSCQQYLMNIPVNYCGKAFLAVPYLHQDHPTLRVLAKFISAKYLLPVVREQNGAYGAGAKINSDGIFCFYSYRDPHSTKTLDAFEKTYEWLGSNADKINQQAVFEAKLGVLQQLDSPIAPGNIGIDNFLYKVSPEMFVNYRTRLLSITVDELKSAIEKYFKNPPKHVGKCILGPAINDLDSQTGHKWKISS